MATGARLQALIGEAASFVASARLTNHVRELVLRWAAAVGGRTDACRRLLSAAMEPTPIVLRIEPPAHSERAQRVLSLLLLVALFFSGLDAAEHGSTTLGWICMAGAAAAAVAFLLLSRRHALVLRWTDAVNGGLFFVAAAGKLAHGKLALPLLQIVAGALLIAVAMLDLPAKRGRLVLDQGGITIRRSFLRRRSVPWTEVSAFALELAAVRIEHSGSPPHVLALRAQLTEAQASAVRRFAAERLQASRSAPGTAS